MVLVIGRLRPWQVLEFEHTNDAMSIADDYIGDQSPRSVLVRAEVRLNIEPELVKPITRPFLHHVVTEPELKRSF